MALTILTSGTTTYNAVIGDDIIVPVDVIRSAPADAILLDELDLDLTINGQVYGGDDAVQVIANDSNIVVGLTGVVQAANMGETDDCAFEYAGTGGHTLRNYGVVGGNIAVDMEGGDFGRIYNHGYMYGDYKAIDIGRFGQIFNTGVIDGGISGIGFTIHNTGEINLISSLSVILAEGSDFNCRIYNHGVINASIIGSDENSFGDRIVNSGVINGTISLGGGPDQYDGRGGTVIGLVSGGTGDDVYTISDAGTLLAENAGQGTDTVRSFASYTLEENFETLKLIGSDDLDGTGNAAANTLLGNAGNNRLSGDDGNDTLSGAQGNDTLVGGGGEDSLRGGIEDDRLIGGLGNDALLGQSGDDLLSGGIGDDVMAGGIGDDILFGGLGLDRMSGNAGADRFVYRSIAESAVGLQADLITDFTHAEDKLDLSRLTTDPMAVAIGGGLSGTGPSLFTTELTGRTLVFIDVDGDGVADMKIILQGAAGVTEADFIL